MKKIDTEKSLIYRFNRLSELTKCVLLLNEKGYFSDYESFSDYKYGTLTEVTVGCTAKEIYPFRRSENEADTGVYSYFIPESKVVFKEEPKKKVYRLYEDVAEFANSVGIRDSDKVQFIRIRAKHGNTQFYLAYNGYEIDTFGTVYIHLGAVAFTFIELFNNYEYTLNSIEWLPFGVEEDEKD